MVDKLRNELWEALYLNPVYPADLLANLKDPDYINVSYIPVNAGCIVELAFYDQGQLIRARYHFDESDQLQKAFMYEGTNESVIYDRQAIVDQIMARLVAASKEECLAGLTA